MSSEKKGVKRKSKCPPSDSPHAHSIFPTLDYNTCEVFHLNEDSCMVSDGKANCTYRPNCLHGIIAKKKGIWSHQSNNQTSKKFNFRKEGEMVGLANMGATCYFNSLLQCLFLNRSFLFSIYRYERNEENIIYYLQELFAHLEYSIKRVYYPHNLISHLSLSVKEQQDVGEFTTLLLSLVEEKFKLSSQPSLRYFISSEFQGRSLYITQCQNCQHRSSSPYNFYALNLHATGYKSLFDCLSAFLGTEDMKGEDKYFCPVCKSKQDAQRTVNIQYLPPVLHIHLLRYVFDQCKKKSNDSISIPYQIDFQNYISTEFTLSSSLSTSFNELHNIDSKTDLMDDEYSSLHDDLIIPETPPLSSTSPSHSPTIIESTHPESDISEPSHHHLQSPFLYDLTAIIRHRGTSANVGHYIADIRDENTNIWYRFDDDKVIQLPNNDPSLTYQQSFELSQKKKKKHSVIPHSLNDSFSSRNAYILIYSLHNRNISSPSSPPSSLLKNILKENQELATILSNSTKQQEQIEQYRINRRELVEQFINSYPVDGITTNDFSIVDNITYYTGPPFRFISTEWLQKWVQGEPEELSDDYDIHYPGTLTHNHLLCPHGLLNPNQLFDIKRISVESWDLFSHYQNDHCFTEYSLCSTCALLSFQESQEKTLLIQFYRQILDCFKIVPAKGEGYLIDNNWKKAIENHLKKFIKNEIDDNIIQPNCTIGLQCPHGRLSLTHPRRRVTPDNWSILQKHFPESKEFSSSINCCSICQKENDEEKNIVLEEKQFRRHLFSSLPYTRKPKAFPDLNSPPKVGHYYLVPHYWLTSFQEYLKNFDISNPLPLDSSSLLCEHSLLLYPPYPNEITRSHISGSSLDIMNIIPLNEYLLIIDYLKYDISNHISLTYFKSNTELSSSLLSNEWSHLDFSLNTPLCSPCFLKKQNNDQYNLFHYYDGCLKIQKISSISHLYLPKRIRRRESQEIIVNSQFTIQKIKLFVFEKFEYYPNQQSLYYNQQLLEDSKTLEDYHIPRDSVLYLIFDSSIDGALDFESLQDKEDIESKSVKKEKGFSGTLLSHS